MPTFEVDVEGQTYEVDAPDERTAWAWANQTHAQSKSTVKPPGMLSGLAQQFNQGITLGGADELQAGVEKLSGGDYRASLERQKREREVFQAQHPYLSAGATAVGAVAPVVASTLAGAAGGPVGVGAAGTAAGGRALQLTLNALYGGGKAIRAEVPLSEMFGYSTSLRSLTQGRATYTMEFKQYAEAPRNVAEAIIAARTK